MRKNHLLPAFAIALLFNIVNAQKVSFDITGGYNVPLARQTEAKTEYVQSRSSQPYFYSTSARLVPVSYGQGGNLAINLNWFSKKNIGFGLKLNVNFGSPFQHSAVINQPGYQEFYDIKSRSFSMQFIPHVCFRYDFKKVSPVLEMGMILGAAFVDHNYIISASNQSTTILTKVRNYGNILVGFYSSMGLSFNVSKVFKINLVLTCSAASYTPARWKRMSFTVGGTNRLSNLAPTDLQGDYVADWDRQSGQRAKTSFAFSGVGFNTGFCFLFGDKKKKKEPQKTEDVRF